MYCPYCGAKLANEEIAPNTKCPKCSKILGDLKSDSEYKCHSCGRDCPEDAVYCWFCGEKFTEDTSEESKKAPLLTNLFYIIGTLEIIGGIIICLMLWSHSTDYMHALTWFFCGLIFGLLFFAIGNVLRYLKRIQYLLEK